MLVECRRICYAQQVFNRLLDRNEYSWTCLMMGYVDCGESQLALNLYQEMQQECVHPSKYTFVTLLKACARLKSAERGQEIHVEIARKGLERDPFVGSTLVDMYAKSGSLKKAQIVFGKLPARHVVSWTTLIAGHVDHGLGEEALNLFEQMQLEGVSPDAVTFVCSLKACGSIQALDKGREIHAAIARNQWERDPFVGSSLVDMYAKCDSLAKAQEVCDSLPVRDVVLWTALLAGYTEHGLSEEALNCFKQMQLEGVSPNTATFVCSLRACSSIGAIDKGRYIHIQVARMGLERDPCIGNTILDMYVKCGLPAKAHEVFGKLPVKDVVSWNILIAGYTEDGLGEEALNFFEQMQLGGVSPDAATFCCSLKACSSIGAIEKGQLIHTDVARKGLERDPSVSSTLIFMYANYGLLSTAQEVFDKLPIQDVVSWTALVAGFTEHGLCEEALNCFEQMQLKGVSPNAVTFICSLKACGSIGAIARGQKIHCDIIRMGWDGDPSVGSHLVNMYAKCGSLPNAQEVFERLPVADVLSWNILIAGYAEHGFGEKALKCFERMQLEGVSPDALTFVCSLKSCASIRAIERGQHIHSEIARHKLEGDLGVGNTLVDMYAKCGSLAKAQQLFDKLPVQDIVSWNALIAGYAQVGESDIVSYMLHKMRGEGFKPDRVTFLGVLTVCSHVGLVDKGWRYFEAMIKDCGIIPTIEHHTCMVDLLGRAGQLDNAVAVVETMPFQPNSISWHTLLGTSQKWGSVELGRQAFEDAVLLDENDAAAYVLMSNIYAGADLQQDKKRVKAMRNMEECKRGWA